MSELLKILQEIRPDVDYSLENKLIDNKIFDSFSVISLITRIMEEFDIEIGPELIIPENFNSIEAIWNMIEKEL